MGLHEHGRLPGEWYGVSKMNEIFKSINALYNVGNNHLLANFKVCEFKNGEIVSKEILKLSMGSVEYDNLVNKNIIND